ncbi:SDR family oxidoreductase [Mycobacterium sp. NPDC050853]|uniref:SDR family NAD(P)-dependent oxidoreductase n=1 Tax=Mycobacterium sp. NPDC050853 TaxID=3155160 RepID=UPI0033FF24FB
MRTAVVTGGGTGIGFAIASALIDAGTRVFITGRRADVLDAAAAALGPHTQALPCDHTDPDHVSRLAAQFTEPIDILVNNAGGNTDFDADAPDGLHELADRWRTNLEANLISAVLTTTALGDRLATGGAVVHIGSIAAHNGAGSYGAAKAALASWNVQLAAELGSRDVTSNVVAPGYIAETEFFRDKLADTRRTTLIASTHTGRAGTPADVANTIGFLTSSGARHITGQVINVNGGALTTI